MTEVEQLPPTGMIDLRLRLPSDDASASQTAAALEAATGIPLPLQPRTSTGDAARQILWMSPDQWLLLCPPEETAPTLAALAKAKEDAALSMTFTDVSDARAIIRLRGDGTRETLMKAMPVDFLPPAFNPGDVRRSAFAGVAAMAHCRAADPDEFDLYVFRSYAAYALAWLQRAAHPEASVTLFREGERAS